MKKIALILTALLLLAGCSGGSDPIGDDGSATAVESMPPAEVDASGGREDIAVATPAPGVPQIGEKVITNASIRLTVPRGDFDETIQQARTIAAGAGGFVVSSETSRPKPGKPTRGSIVLRVPEKAYASALGSLESLGRVENRQESSVSVTAEYVDLQARVRHLEAVERQLLALLDKADTVEAALAVQASLNDTQLQLEEARGQLRYLDDQTAYATISIELAERFAPAPGSDGRGIVGAWADGAQAFLSVAAWTFVAVATIAPLAFLVGAIALAVRFARRRRLRAA